LPAAAAHTASSDVASLAVTRTQQPERSVPRAAVGARVETLPDGDQLIHWAVKARILGTSDKSVVSPEFLIDVPGVGACPFRMVLVPRAKGDSKGAGSFRKAKGHGKIELKCEAELPEHVPPFKVFLWIGETPCLARGPVQQRFAQQSVCSLPREDDDWDFAAVVDDSDSFVVHALLSSKSA